MVGPIAGGGGGEGGGASAVSKSAVCDFTRPAQREWRPSNQLPAWCAIVVSIRLGRQASPEAGSFIGIWLGFVSCRWALVDSRWAARPAFWY